MKQEREKMAAKYGLDRLFEKCFKIVLANLMVYESAEATKYYKPKQTRWFGISAILLTTSLIVKLARATSVKDILELSIYLIYVALMVMVAGNWSTDRSEILKKILAHVRSNVYEYSNGHHQWEHERYIKESESLKDVKLMVLIVVLLLYGGFATIILSYIGLTYFLRNAEAEDFEKYILIPGWLPYQISNWFIFLFTWSFQAVTFFPVLYCAASSISVSFYLHRIIQKEKNSLIETVRIVCKNINEKEDVLVRQIRECLEHHAAILKLMRGFIYCYRGMVFSTMGLGCLMSSISVYLFITDEDFVFAKSVQHFTILAVSIVSLYYYCHIGDGFKQLNKEFKEAIYSSPWYEHSIRLRKLFLLIMYTTNWEVNIGITATKILSYPLFVAFAKANYTYINYLLNTTKV